MSVEPIGSHHGKHCFPAPGGLLLASFSLCLWALYLWNDLMDRNQILTQAGGVEWLETYQKLATSEARFFRHLGKTPVHKIMGEY